MITKASYLALVLKNIKMNKIALNIMGISATLAIISIVAINYLSNKYPDCNNKNSVCGFIDEHFEKKVEKIISQGNTEVRISSNGGFHDIAIRIVDSLNDKNIKIVIDGICFSSCAQDLLLGTRKVELTNNAIIAYHQSATSMNKLAHSIKLSNIEYLKHLQFYADIESEFIKKHAISPSVLTRPAYELKYKCYNLTIKKRGYDMEMYVESDYNLFLPTKDIINYWRGYEDLTNYPNTLSDIEKRIKIYPDYFSKNKFVISSETDVNPKIASFSKVEKCKY
jgi:hypothetical protein